MSISDLIYNTNWDIRFFKWLKKSGHDFNQSLSTKDAMPLNMLILRLSTLRRFDPSEIPAVNEIINLIFKQNIDVNKTATGWPSPLTHAIQLNEFELAEELIKRGADIQRNSKTKNIIRN